ncbi:hypothetical protein F2P79_019049 [Pimephales promelas]|nr:hypothetical protein F2P79_019049 [Pimephales promelas]
MDERDSHCPYLLSSETTAKGTGLAESAGKEDPVEIYPKMFVKLKIAGVFFVLAYAASPVARVANIYRDSRMKSNAPAASDDSGSLQEQVKQDGTMLKMFAHTGQSAGQGWLIEPRPGTVRTTQNSPTNRALVVKRALARFKLASLRFLTIKCERDLKTTMWRMLQSIFSNHLSINITWSGVGDKACFRDMFLKTIVQRAIRKNPATQDATDEAIQVNVTHHLKGASDHAGGKRHR